MLQFSDKCITFTAEDGLLPIDEILHSSARPFLFKKIIMKHLTRFTGLLGFLTVLLTMPLGHALMIIMEKTFSLGHVYLAAFLLGFAGLLLLLFGSRLRSENKATFAGLFAGLFIWTGWIEFGFVYIAHRYHVQPLVENGVVVTKPEYLIMPASAGFLVIMMLHYLFSTRTGCVFFSWLQKYLRIPVPRSQPVKVQKNFAVITTVELIALLWTFYLVLLFAYDHSFLGDRHPVTYLIAFGSLLWSLFFVAEFVQGKADGVCDQVCDSDGGDILEFCGDHGAVECVGGDMGEAL